MKSRVLSLILGLALLSACGPRQDAPPAAPETPPAPGASAPAETPAAAPGSPAPDAAETPAADGAETPSAEAPRSGAFDSTPDWLGKKFHVTCPNDSSMNVVTITPSGLEGSNDPVTREVDGTVMGAEVGDLDIDGSPEIYVYVQSAGSGSYGSVVGYASSKDKPLVPIKWTPVSENPEASKGYMGHDEFAVVESVLAQRFPIYNEGDTNAEPTGKMRQVQYKLETGDEGPALKADKVVEF